MGIRDVISLESAWTKKADDEDGMQIDMLISRKDNVVNMCEIKFYGDDFVVSKEYYRIIQRRIEVLLSIIPRRMFVYSTLITTYGLKKMNIVGLLLR